MTLTTGRLRGSLLRFGTAVALAALVLGASGMPASAQVVNRGVSNQSDKAERKAAKRAARLNQGSAQRSVVVDNGVQRGVLVAPTGRRGVVANNGPVIDRSNIPTQVKPSRNRTPNNKNYTYRNGYYYDRNGNRVYDYRNSPVDPYAAYPQYRRNNSYSNYPYSNQGSNYGYYGNNSGYYGNGGYYNGYPNYGSYNNGKGDADRDEVYRRGAQNGYYSGFQRGQFDASQRNRPVPTGHGAYEFGYDGFDPSWGWASTYQQAYRQAFVQGYNDGYSRRGDSSRYPQRRW